MAGGAAWIAGGETVRVSALIAVALFGCSDAHGPGCGSTCLTLQPTHRGGAHGHVLTAQGTAVTGATVSLLELGSNRVWPADAPTSESGAYRVIVEVNLATSGLPDPDTLRGTLRATAPGGQGSAVVAVPLRPLGETTVSVVRDIVLANP